MAGYAVFEGKYNVTSVTVTLTIGLALYNSLELLLLVLITFKDYSGLYFWSMIISIVSIISYSNGLIIEYFQTAPMILGLVLDNAGWMAMISGQSLVLYSRLGLIVSNHKILQAVKWMIIVDAVVFYTGTTVLNFGARYTGNIHFVHGYFYMEQIQMTFFCAQEFIISGIYLWQTVKFLKVSSKQGTRKVMWQLFTINIVIIILDLVLLVIEYKNLHIYEQSVKAFVYSVKLKLEFTILGKLIELAQENQRNLANTLSTVDDVVRRSDSATVASAASGGISAAAAAAAAATATTITERPQSLMSSSIAWIMRGHQPSMDHLENGLPHSNPKNNHNDSHVVHVNGEMRPFSLEIDRRFSEQGSVGSGDRLQGRESDMLYADIVRSISRP